MSAGPELWRELGPRMLELERNEWRSRAFSERDMRQQITSPRSIIGAIFDGPTLLGFAVAGPGWTRGRATLFNVLIDPAHRGRGLVWPMLRAMEGLLLERGFTELVIDARIENGFADAVERRYASCVSVLAADHPSPYGPQRTIAVRLTRGARPAPRATRSPRATTRSRTARAGTSESPRAPRHLRKRS